MEAAFFICAALSYEECRIYITKIYTVYGQLVIK